MNRVYDTTSTEDTLHIDGSIKLPFREGGVYKNKIRGALKRGSAFKRGFTISVVSHLYKKS